MQDFPANSQKAKARSEQEEKKIERVTSGEVVRRKRGLGRQFKNTFIGGSARTAAEYMIGEVVVPSIKDMLFEAFQGGLEKLVYGESRVRRGSPPSSYSNVGHVNYQRMSSSPPTSRPSSGGPMLSRRARGRHEFDDIVIQSHREALDVIDQMFEILSRYGSVSVADLYGLTGIQGSHVDYKWGWTELRGAKAARLPRGGGFLLDLPEPQPLD